MCFLIKATRQSRWDFDGHYEIDMFVHFFLRILIRLSFFFTFYVFFPFAGLFLTLLFEIKLTTCFPLSICKLTIFNIYHVNVLLCKGCQNNKHNKLIMLLKFLYGLVMSMVFIIFGYVKIILLIMVIICLLET